MSPLDPNQTQQQEQQAAKEGWLHRSLVAFDQGVNVILLRGLPDETISAHASRAALAGKGWGKALSGFLNLFQKDHGPKAQAGDLERAKNIEQVEEKSGGIDEPPASSN